MRETEQTQHHADQVEHATVPTPRVDGGDSTGVEVVDPALEALVMRWCTEAVQHARLDADPRGRRYDPPRARHAAYLLLELGVPGISPVLRDRLAATCEVVAVQRNLRAAS